jgi:hypothetical protein
MADPVENKDSLAERLEEDREKNGDSGERAERRLQCAPPVESVRSEISVGVDYRCGAYWFLAVTPTRPDEKKFTCGQILCSAVRYGRYSLLPRKRMGTAPKARSGPLLNRLSARLSAENFTNA